MHGLVLTPPVAARIPQVDITIPQALCFLCLAASMLVGLYLLIQAGVNIVIVRSCV